MKNRVVFRADGTVQMGLGHLVRSKALADMLADDFEITFVSRTIADAIRQDLIDSGYKTHTIHSEPEFLSLIGSEDLVVLDGYQFGFDYQVEVRSRVKALACIDDLMNPVCHADLIINQTPGVMPDDYQALPDTLFALGSDYTLLRSPFLEAARKGDASGDRSTVFICFGGSDAQDLIKSTWEVVRTSGQFRRIILVTGASYQHLESLLELIKGDQITEHYHQVDADRMCTLMSEAGLKIVPSSGILFEALATGGSVISGYYTKNQVPNYEYFLAQNAILDAGTFEAAMVKKALEGRATFTTPQHIVDGYSQARYRELFLGLGKRINQNVIKTT